MNTKQIAQLCELVKKYKVNTKNPLSKKNQENNNKWLIIANIMKCGKYRQKRKIVIN